MQYGFRTNINTCQKRGRALKIYAPTLFTKWQLLFSERRPLGFSFCPRTFAIRPQRHHYTLMRLHYSTKVDTHCFHSICPAALSNLSLFPQSAANDVCFVRDSFRDSCANCYHSDALNDFSRTLVF